MRYLIFIIILTCGCKLAGDSEDEVCLPYFQYDQLEHYSKNISFNSSGHTLPATHPAFENDPKAAITTGERPENTSDSTFIVNLEMIGYTKKEISAEHFPEIDYIFCAQNKSEAYDVSCLPTYRDIFVFRNNDSVVGVVKVCFECGTSRVTREHGTEEVVDVNGKLNILARMLKY